MRDKFIEDVLAGKVPGVCADPDNPALAFKFMDIYSEPGTKVRFTGYNGRDFEQKKAREKLEIDCTYIVERTNVGGWSSTVELKEFPGEKFNTVMFAAVEEG